MNNFKRECMASGDREEKTVFVIIPLSSDFSQCTLSTYISVNMASL